MPLSTVEEFVKAGHNNLPRTKEMLEREPGLLNAAWDWGDGDFETALGGASHVGNREIARYLIGEGARMNLFTSTMLGEVEIVKPWLDAYPDLVHSKGPHGLSLLHHAERGGNAEMVDLIKSRTG
ncbi:ankyrin repeat domain-containing protein [bacterium]|nr:ankyrin repeat domain-containing protein [bacterium]